MGNQTRADNRRLQEGRDCCAELAWICLQSLYSLSQVPYHFVRTQLLIHGGRKDPESPQYWQSSWPLTPSLEGTSGLTLGETRSGSMRTETRKGSKRLRPSCQSTSGGLRRTYR